MTRSFSVEPGRVYVELVAALFTAVVPLAIMAVTFTCVGAFVVVGSGDAIAAATLVVGIIAIGGKAWLQHAFRRSATAVRLTPTDAARWERGFAIGNLAFAAALGTLAARSFAIPQVGLQLLSTGMLFGFCAGQVARVAVRERLCSVSICVAAVPCVFAAAAHGGVAHLGLAVMFVVFAVGSIESVRFAYSQTRERIATNHELTNVASLDPLTGLYNRLGLRRTAAELFDASTRSQLVAVHCLDLDGFKAVNDRHGHAAGDALLVEIAGRLKACAGNRGVVARFGGDEFVCVQTVIDHLDEAEMFARRICRTVTAPHIQAGRALEVGMSIGTCTGTAGRDAFDDLFGVADQRMYRAKQLGGGVYSEARTG